MYEYIARNSQSWKIKKDVKTKIGKHNLNRQAQLQEPVIDFVRLLGREEKGYSDVKWY